MDLGEDSQVSESIMRLRVKECGVNHRINSQLIAIVADEGRKRLYIEPTTEQEAIASVKAPEDIPHGALPIFPQRFSPPSFGLTDYVDLFTNRQLIFITTMMRLAREAQDAAEKAAIEKGMPDDGISFAAGGSGALAYAEAVRMALVLTVSKLLDRCSNLCSWSSSSGGSLRNVFSRAAPSYNEQIDRLKNVHYLLIPDEKIALEILKKVNYYCLNA